MKTRMSGTDRQGSAGFTLFELLAVLTVIALVAVALSFSRSASSGTAQFRAAIANTSAILRLARAQALASARSQVVVINLDGRRVVIAGADQGFDISREIKVLATVAESEHYSDGTVGIRFFGDGTSTGGIVAYAWRGQNYEIEVNWLTGSVSVRDGRA